MSQVTTLLLMRYRYHIVVRRETTKRRCWQRHRTWSASRDSRKLHAGWTTREAEALLAAEPDANIALADATRFLSRILESFPKLQEEQSSAPNSVETSCWRPTGGCVRRRA